MGTKIVVGQSSITAGQMKDFWRKVEDSTIDGELFGYFLENPSKYAQGAVTVARAIRILGARNVLTPEQATDAINLYGAKANLPLLAPPASVPIGYTEQSLREHKALDEQEFGKGNGPLLAYSCELSLRELRRRFGIGPSGFYPTAWDQDPKEDYWAEQPGQPGWYLISMQGRFGATNWADQETKIARLGPYERLHERTLANIALPLLHLQGKRVPDYFWHWGDVSSAPDGCRAYVRFYNGGFHVGHCPLGVDDDDSVRILVARKFDS
ncbi:MAG: hypothetical protein A2667_00890 [Candidatus Wildermuthbacteria bacterium RIFCSPHIGHO2_01_FULL_47_27]|uniref:Uncharacterized protein n=2 Tax=Candidatus Wildermuthiibacteriota TaxID=1817923 RepID=A0A1G2RTP4_9BACT|nr:MAG: hypothetical protein UY15_C0014G0028 [Parcubacteria group bacterium GW2011_GWA2_47_9]OHA65007.1 MAG: hypothetical protein A2667_00890 [Candidatus Wildermuthbacteria bacterium RIFCSPHIGHO2_01_FULL_47_27]OHA67003.1 MAG: hypothetical protein A3D59_01595 [Candidatus Wildermuthbacteria bacterium RIFCSPHIGHO2_02_FULL_47_17]OHA75441.1 MAG: hypothetical protein A3A32_00165 [Candidatus Wildermuthbacteria bacterium RIFCSPLOWO2_01_FULL_48_35]